MTNYIIGGLEIAAGVATGNLWVAGAGIATVASGLLNGNQDIKGPRLKENPVTTSTLGSMIPFAYGTIRTAGNMIWSTPMVETSHTQSQGKGGSGPTSTTYTYSKSFAIAIHDGPITGIKRIWANGKLIYDISPSSQSHRQSAMLPMTIYYGTETQLPDATIQANVGVNLCPAYRGTAYVVYTNLQLADFGNSVPNLEFEIVVNGSAAPSSPVITTTPYQLSGLFLEADALGNFSYVTTSVGDANSGYYSMCVTSIDGVTWYPKWSTQATPHTYNNLSYYNQGLGMIYGNNLLYPSRDGMFLWAIIGYTKYNDPIWGWAAFNVPNGACFAHATPLSGIPSIYEMRSGNVNTCYHYWTSNDGLYWYQHDNNPVRLYNVAAVANNNMFFYYSNSTYFLMNGNNGDFGFQPYGRITYGNGLYAIIGGMSSVYSSQDCVVWTKGNITLSSGYEVCFGDGVFVVMDGGANLLWYSSDCINWFSVSGCGYASYISYANGLFVGIYGYSVTTWTPSGAVTNLSVTCSNIISSYNSGGSPIVFNGGNKIIILSPATTNQILYSEDGKTFSIITLPGTYYLQAISYGNGIFVILTTISSFFYSLDGQVWSQGTLPISLGTILQSQFTFSSGNFVAVTSSYLFQSHDGITWTYKKSILVGAIYYKINKLWIFSTTKCATSIDDGNTWLSANLPVTLSSSYQIVFSNNLCIILQPSTTFLYSGDGITWFQGTFPDTPTSIYPVYGNGVFSAIGRFGGTTKSYYSYDGVNWTVGSTIGTSTIYGLYFGNGCFISLGFGGNKGFFSNDGINYQSFSTPTITSPQYPWSCAYLKNYLISSYATNILTVQTPLSVGDITSDICVRAGLTTRQFDTSAIDNPFGGYIVASQTNPRNILQPLMEAFLFDAVESSGVLKFVKRGSLTPYPIPENDLAAHQYGSIIPDQLLITRAQDVDMPREISIKYEDANASYQIGEQYSRRSNTKSINKKQIQIPIAISANQGKQIADAILYSTWASRNSFILSVSNKYMFVEPTDVLNITKGNITYTMRVVDKSQANDIITFNCVSEDNVYSQTSFGANYKTQNNIIQPIVNSVLYMLDIPILQDHDDGIGFYVAVFGNGNGWTGCSIYKSNDQSNWGNYGTSITTNATIGYTATTLGNFSSGNIFDEINTVGVFLINGTLYSTTEINVLNGSNYALLGNEIIGFKNALLIGNNTYTLSGLLRGVRGTEWAMGSHTNGETFIFLDPSTLRLETSNSSEYNLQRYYKAVSFGQYLSNAVIVNFTNTAVAQKPYAPVQLGGGRDAAGNITINWIRRSRIQGAWLDNIDVPIGETSENYTIQIWDSAYANLMRTISATSPTASYTSSQQISDFGSNQSTIYVIVFQNSLSIGAGYGLKGTI